MIPEPEDKLDATTTPVVVVSGLEDATLGWRQIDWRHAEREVRRLRQRIFTASKAGDLPRVRRLQKLMLRSRSNTLVSVRRVTERNKGRLAHRATVQTSRVALGHPSHALKRVRA